MGPVPGPRGGTTPEDNSENISRIFVGSVHACTCFSRCAHCVLGVPVRLLRVSLLHMSPFLNIIPSHSNVLLHMSQSRALQMIAQTLFILLSPSLNSGDAIRRLPVYTESRMEDESNTSAMFRPLPAAADRH